MNGANDLSEIIGKLTENPDMMKSLMGIAGNLMGGDGDLRGSDKPKKESFEPEKTVKHGYEKGAPCDEVACRTESDERHGKRGRGNDAENLIRLLLALKPYVSRERCEKIDGIVKILKLVQLSEKSGLLKSLL